MKKLFYVLALLVLVSPMFTGNALAAPVSSMSDYTVLETKIYDTEGQEDSESLTTGLSFTILFVAYSAGEGDSAKIEVDGITDEMDAVLHVGPGLSDEYTYENGVITWEGALNSTGSSEIWIEVPNNYWYLSTWVFPAEVTGSNMEPSFYEFSVTNPDEPPAPIVELETWVIDDLGTANPDGLTTSEDFTTLGIVYVQVLNLQVIEFTATLEGYPSESNPEFLTNGNVVVAEQSWNGDTLTVAGTMTTGLGVGNELIVHVDNVFYESTQSFTITVAVEGAEAVSRTLFVTNPEELPKPMLLSFIPVVYKDYVVTLPPAPIKLDVSASDGLNSSWETGELVTTQSFNINWAVWPQNDETLNATVSVSEFAPEWGTSAYVEDVLTGEPVYDGVSTWAWSGTLKTGFNVPSEGWVIVPDDVLHGTRIFIVTVSIDGFAPMSGQVTVTSP